MRVPGIPRSKNATTLVKESTLVAVSQLITIALGFITLLLLGKGLSLEDFGRYQFLLAIVASCQLLTLSGYGVVLTKAVFDGNDSALVTAVKHSLTAGVIIFCPLAAVGWKGAELGYIDESTTQMIFFVATLSILSPFDKLSDYLVAKRKFTRSRAIIVLQALLTCILVGGAATWYGTIFPVLIATVVAKAMTHCLAIPLTLSVFKRASVKEHSTHDKALFIQAAKYTAVSSTSVAATQIDRIMLGLLDESALAIYVMGSYIPKRVKDNFKVIASVATTYLGQKTQGEYISLLSRYRLKFNILS